MTTLIIFLFISGNISRYLRFSSELAASEIKAPVVDILPEEVTTPLIVDKPPIAEDV